jgi:hypothetical protein
MHLSFPQPDGTQIVLPQMRVAWGDPGLPEIRRAAHSPGCPSWNANYGGKHTLPGGVVMDTDALPGFHVIDGSYAEDSAPYDNNHAALVSVRRARGAMSVRMQLLHFENIFGDVRVSEYCSDAMLSLVLLMARGAKHDADRLARLTGATDAAYPAAKDGFCPGAAAGRDVAAVRPTG